MIDFKHARWTSTDIQALEHTLKAAAQPEKEAWARRMLNTHLPLWVVSTPLLRRLAKDIHQSDAQAFLHASLIDAYETRALKGLVISLINEATVQLAALEAYAPLIECWALCDLLRFNITPSNQELYAKAARDYLQAPHAMIRRLGLWMRFAMLNDQTSLETSFDLLLTLDHESDYYVQMMAAWLLSEAWIRYPEATESFLNTNEVHPAIVNKAIQKSRESLRLSAGEKEALLRFKRVVPKELRHVRK